MIYPTLSLMGHHMTADELALLEYGYRTGNPIHIYGAFYMVLELSKGISIFGAGVVNIQATLRKLPPQGLLYPRRK